MRQKVQIGKNDKVFCNGAFLQPFEIEINGRKQWRWILVGSEDDSYLDGERIGICDYADELQGLVVEES